MLPEKAGSVEVEAELVPRELLANVDPNVRAKRWRALSAYRDSLIEGPSSKTTLESLRVAAKLMGWAEKPDARGRSETDRWMEMADVPWEHIRKAEFLRLRALLSQKRVIVAVDEKGKEVEKEVKYASTSANKHLYTVRVLLGHMFDEGLIDASEMEHLRRVKRVKGREEPAGRALKKSEMTSLLDACDLDTPRGVRDHAIFKTLHCCGLRRDEVGSLTVDAYSSKHLKVVGKGNVTRIVPVPVALKAAIDRWLAIRGRSPGPLFTRFYPGASGKIWLGERLSSQAIFKLLMELIAKSGVEKCSPHDMRRTYASDLLSSGVDITTVQKLMGHVNQETTARYDRRSEQVNDEAVERMMKYREELQED